MELFENLKDKLKEQTGVDIDSTVKELKFIDTSKVTKKALDTIEDIKNIDTESLKEKAIEQVDEVVATTKEIYNKIKEEIK